GNTWAVQATGVVTSLVTGGSDHVIVGNAGSVQGIATTLNLEGPGHANILALDDSADTTARTATLSTLGSNPYDSQGNGDPWGQVVGLAPAAINYEYGDTARLTVQTGSTAGSVVNVRATSAPVNVVGHASLTVNVGAGGSLQTIAGTLG